MLKRLFFATAVLMCVTTPTGVAKTESPAAAGEPEVVSTVITATDEAEPETRYTVSNHEVSGQRMEYAAIEVTPSAEELFADLYPGEDYNETITVLAKLLWGEARGVESDTNKACVIWCVLNRVDGSMRGDTVIECATAPHQFNYHKRFHVEESLKSIAEDVLERWLMEKTGAEDAGRVLPENYCFFSGNGENNVFRDQYTIQGSDRITPVHSEVYGD